MGFDKRKSQDCYLTFILLEPLCKNKPEPQTGSGTFRFVWRWKFVLLPDFVVIVMRCQLITSKVPLSKFHCFLRMQSSLQMLWVLVCTISAVMWKTHQAFNRQNRVPLLSKAWVLIQDSQPIRVSCTWFGALQNWELNICEAGKTRLQWYCHCWAETCSCTLSSLCSPWEGRMHNQDFRRIALKLCSQLLPECNFNSDATCHPFSHSLLPGFYRIWWPDLGGRAVVVPCLWCLLSAQFRQAILRLFALLLQLTSSLSSQALLLKILMLSTYCLLIQDAFIGCDDSTKV